MAKGDGLPTVRDVPKTAKKSGAMRFFWIAALVIIGVGLAFLLISRRNPSSSGETVLSEENIYGPGTANDGTTVPGGGGGVPAPPRPEILPKPIVTNKPPPRPGGHKPPPTKIGKGHPIHRKRSGGSGSANPPSSTTYSEPGNFNPKPRDTSTPFFSGAGGVLNWLFGGPNPRVPLF